MFRKSIVNMLNQNKSFFLRKLNINHNFLLSAFYYFANLVWTLPRIVFFLVFWLFIGISNLTNLHDTERQITFILSLIHLLKHSCRQKYEAHIYNAMNVAVSALLCFSRIVSSTILTFTHWNMKICFTIIMLLYTI